MQEKHDIETYSKLAEGATFFLNESFRYVNESLIDESAAKIFSKLIDKIEPSDKDRELLKTPMPEKAIDLLQLKRLDVISEETIAKMSFEWHRAQNLARTQKAKFKYNHRINSIELLGHLNNLGFFIETLTNRHLLFLVQSKQLDTLSYSRFSTAKIMERLLFIFKDELTTNKFTLNEIANLFSLRNKTVHYTPENAVALKPTISELFQIWKQCIQLIEKFEKVQKFNEIKFSIDLKNHFEQFKQNWT